MLRTLASCSAAAALIVAPALMSSAVADTTADGATVVVTPEEPQGWAVPEDGQAGGGTSALVDGPGTPPLGDGSLNLLTPLSGDKISLGNADYLGTRLADITAMSYSTYIGTPGTGSDQQAPSYQLPVDVNGPEADGGFTTLVFEPVYNTDQGAVAEDTWQSWDAFADGGAIWWSTREIPGACATSCYVTWNDIVAANPDATLYGVILNQGTGNEGLDANVDAVTLGAGEESTTWDFEAVEPATPEGPTTKDDCKKGGWKDFEGEYTFRNQGDCVSYVATGGKHHS